MTTQNETLEDDDVGAPRPIDDVIEASDLLQSARKHAQENEAPEQMPAIRVLIEAAQGRLHRAASTFDDEDDDVASVSRETQDEAEPFDVLDAVEECSGDLDSLTGVIRLAIADIEGDDTDVRSFHVVASEIHRIRDALNGIEERMIGARGRSGWRIGGAA